MPADVGRGVAVVLFTDLVGSTELRGRLGEEAADELRRQHDRLLTQAVEANHGRVVKGLGDGIMATFGGASDAVAAAVAIQQGIDRLNRTGKEPLPLAVRVGLSAGDVAFEDDDVHGTPVIEASRLCAAAAGGEILVAEVVRILAALADAHLRDQGPLELKGLPRPLPAWAVQWEPAAVSTIPVPALLTDVGRIFVGRDAELEHLERWWKEAAAGERRVALLAGEPGVGKTRLAAELTIRVHDEGGLVLAGRCDEDLGVPYQPFVEALRHFVDHTPESELAGRLGRYGGELVRLVPELAQRVPGLDAPLQSDPETERYRLFDAVAAWLLAAAADDPVLLVLDDLQWSAKPTLLLLRHLVRASRGRPLLVVGTYRDTELTHDHPLIELVADLRRDGAVERVALSGLDDVAVAAILEHAAGQALDDDGVALAQAIYQETEGNPFFVREVLRHLAESKAIERRGDRWATRVPIDQLGIPEGIRDVVGRRLARLSHQANEALRVAAVVGTEFAVDLVQAAGAFAERELLAALDEAVDARVVSEVAPARFRFSHALVRATLYDSLTGVRTITLHRHVAEAIETLHEAALDDSLPALAHHWAKASGPAADAARAVHYAARAGDRALAQLAHDEAVAYYQQALELLGTPRPSGDEHQRLCLLINLGEAQRRAGDPGQRDTLLQAVRLAQDHGDPDALIRAALANTRRILFSRYAATDAERIATLEAALAVVDPADLTRRARLLASLALELTYDEEASRRLELAEEALATARRSGDPTTLANVLLQRAWATSTPATLARRREDTAELLAVAAQMTDPVVRAQASLVSCRTLGEAGEFAEFDRQLHAGEQLALEVGEPTLRWMARAWRGGRALFAGRLAEAEAAANDGFDLGVVTGQSDAEWFFAVTLVGIRFEQDRLPEVVDNWVDFDRTGRWGRVGPAAFLAWAGAELEDPELASRHLDAMASRDFADVPFNNTWLHLLCFAATAAVYLEDGSRCAALHHLLERYADQVAGTLLWWLGSVSHYLALLTAALGRRDEAEARFVAAAAAHERMGSPVCLARTRLEWARLLLTRRQAGDAERARQLLDRILDAGEQHGLPNIERRAAALMRDNL